MAGAYGIRKDHYEEVRKGSMFFYNNPLLGETNWRPTKTVLITFDEALHLSGSITSHISTLGVKLPTHEPLGDKFHPKNNWHAVLTVLIYNSEWIG
jgi:hypothetical protein